MTGTASYSGADSLKASEIGETFAEYSLSWGITGNLLIWLLSREGPIATAVAPGEDKSCFNNE